MSTTPAIVAIGSDPALLRSLAFALEAHGHRVETFRSWKAARDLASIAFCVILDGSLAPAERQACMESLAPGVGIVLLADDDTAHPDHGNLLVLHKPLAGPDVVSALATFDAQAT